MDPICSVPGSYHGVAEASEGVHHRGTFSSTTVDTLSLPKDEEVLSTSGCVVSATPPVSSGTRGEFYGNRTTPGFAVKNSGAETATTLRASHCYLCAPNTFGRRMQTMCCPFASASITDHGGVGPVGQLENRSLADSAEYLASQGTTAELKIPGNKVYGFRQSYNFPAGVVINPQPGAILATYYSVSNAGYKWHPSANGAGVYYLTDANGNDPVISEPYDVHENGALMTKAKTSTSLAVSSWAWDDQDALGFRTLYVHLTDSTSPDGKALNYVTAGVTIRIQNVAATGLYQWIDSSLGGRVEFGAAALSGSVLPQWWGGSPSASVTTNTSAFASALASIATYGGEVFLSAGTWNGNFIASKLGNTSRVRIRGAGMGATVLQSNSGIILDLAGSGKSRVSDLTINCESGSDIGLMAGRLTPSYTTAGCASFYEAIEIIGTPSVAGLYHVSAETSTYLHCLFHTGGKAPVAVISGTNSLSYRYPNGSGTHTLYEAGNQITIFQRCNFVKYPGRGNTRNTAEIGGNVAALSFEQCYFHAVNGSSGLDINGNHDYNISVRDCSFECNDSNGSAHGISITGHLTITNLIIEGNFFYQGRTESSFYDVYAPNATLLQPSISNNKSAKGGGLYLYNTSEGDIDYAPPRALLNGAVSSGTDSFTVASGSHSIRVGDTVVVGKARSDDNAGSVAAPEQRTVIAIAPGSPDTVRVDRNFSYNHSINASIRYGTLRFNVDFSSTIRSAIYPTFASYPSGSFVQIRGRELPNRIYYGSKSTGTITSQQGPCPVLLPFRDEPANPEAGMLATDKASGEWATTKNLDGFSQQNFLAFYSDRWYALPLAFTGNATWDPKSIANGASESINVSIPGTTLGDYAIASLGVDAAGLTLTAAVKSADRVTVTLANNTGCPIDLPSSSVRVLVMRH